MESELVNKATSSPQVREKQQNGLITLIAIQSVLLFVLLVFSIVYPSLPYLASELIDPACWAIVLVSLWSFWSWQHISGTLFDPYVLFLLSAVLFNGGLAYLQIFGLNTTGIMAGRFSYETTLTALLIVAIGLAAFHLGALLAAFTKKDARTRQSGLKLDTTEAYHLRRIGVVLIAVSIVPSLILMGQDLSVVMAGGYFALFQQQLGTGVLAGPRILASFLIPGCLFLLAGSDGSRVWLITSSFLLLLQVAVTLLLGSRLEAIGPLLAFAWVWHRCVKPLPIKLLVVSGAVLLIVIFPAIRAVRNIALGERFSVDAILAAYTTVDNPATSSIAEAGSTLVTTAYTVDLVPSVRPFDYGAQYFYSALAVMPNFFWDVHPTISHGTPADWLVQTVEPVTAAAGGGLGYSFIAEAFLNLGFWGSPIVLFVIGYLYARFVIWGAWSQSPMRIASVGIYLSFFIFFARSDSSNIMRPLVWYVLVPVLGYMLLSYLVVISLQIQHEHKQ